MSIQEVHVQRLNIVTSEPFDALVARIDAEIGHPDMAAFRKSLSAAARRSRNGGSSESGNSTERDYGVYAVRSR
jgi:hypothetical protein